MIQGENYEQLIAQVKKELAQSLSVHIEAYNEPYGGPRIKVQLSLDDKVISEWDTDVPEPKTYTGF